MWKSPNGTIRNILDGTVFREPIVMQNVPRLVTNWTAPIIVGRHASGDQYRATDTVIKGKENPTMTFTPEGGGEPLRYLKYTIIKEMCGHDHVQHRWKHHGFCPAAVLTWPWAKMASLPLKPRIPFWKKMGRFKDIFENIYQNEFKAQFDAAGITYEHRLYRRHGLAPWNGTAILCGLVRITMAMFRGYGSTGIRKPWAYDLSIGYSWWLNHGSWSCPWHCYPPLPRPPGRKTNQHQPDSIYFLPGQGTYLPWQAGQ